VTNLVGQYIGHTAPKTKEVLKRAMGGVLFIDEAYYLYRPENERDYGQEAIEILMQVMENQRDDLVVIFAATSRGWTLSSRAIRDSARGRSPHRLPGLLDRRARRDRGHDGRRPRPAALPRGSHRAREYLELRRAQPNFANARSVRNALDRARLRQARRLLEAGRVDAAMLMTIEAADIRASRVFDAARAAAAAEE